jgi:hypothetical protein
MNPKDIVGRTITNIFQTKSSAAQDGIPGQALYFNMIIELDGFDLYDLGAHEISIWTKRDQLVPFEMPAWAVQKDFKVIGRIISKVIQRDPEEFYDGSLTLLLENNIILEHQTTNGDQLFIDQFKGKID